MFVNVMLIVLHFTQNTNTKFVTKECENSTTECKCLLSGTRQQIETELIIVLKQAEKQPSFSE